MVGITDRSTCYTTSLKTDHTWVWYRLLFRRTVVSPSKWKRAEYGTEKEHMRNQHMAKKRVNEWRVENLAGLWVVEKLTFCSVECGGLFKAVREAS